MPTADELCAQLDNATGRAKELVAENSQLRSVLLALVTAIEHDVLHGLGQWLDQAKTVLAETSRLTPE